MKSAEYLKGDILEYADELPDVSWPPTFEELNSEIRQPPLFYGGFTPKGSFTSGCLG